MSFYNTIISGWGRLYREGLSVHSGKCSVSLSGEEQRLVDRSEASGGGVGTCV